MEHVEQATAAPGEKRNVVRGLVMDEQFTEITLDGLWVFEEMSDDRVVLVRG